MRSLVLVLCIFPSQYCKRPKETWCTWIERFIQQIFRGTCYMPGTALDIGETVNEMTKILCLPTTHSSLKIITYFTPSLGRWPLPHLGRWELGQMLNIDTLKAPMSLSAELRQLPSTRAVHPCIRIENLTCLELRLRLHVTVTQARLNINPSTFSVPSLPALWSCTWQL